MRTWLKNRISGQANMHLCNEILKYIVKHDLYQSNSYKIKEKHDYDYTKEIRSDMLDRNKRKNLNKKPLQWKLSSEKVSYNGM